MDLRLNDEICSAATGELGVIVGFGGDTGRFAGDVRVKWRNGTYFHKPKFLADPARSAEISKANRLKRPVEFEEDYESVGESESTR